jgi:uncharacterized protein (TIRG00374 family)
LLYLAFRGVDWREIVRTVQGARVEYLALALCLITAASFIRSLRWRVLLSAEKSLPPVTVFWATMAGYLGNNFLPARAGEVIRTVLIGQAADLSKSFVLATALTERMMDVVALVLISLAALSALHGLPAELLKAVQVMSAVSLVGLAGLFVLPRLEGVIEKIARRLPVPETLRVKLVGMVAQFLVGLRALQHPGRALSFAGLTSVIWLSDALGTMVIAQALNLSLALPQALLLLAALGLASAAPSTPGYVGIYQFVAVAVLEPFGFSQSEALAYVLVAQAMMYVVVLVWGVLGLWRLTARSRL